MQIYGSIYRETKGMDALNQKISTAQPPCNVDVIAMLTCNRPSSIYTEDEIKIMKYGI